MQWLSIVYAQVVKAIMALKRLNSQKMSTLHQCFKPQYLHANKRQIADVFLVMDIYWSTAKTVHRPSQTTSVLISSLRA